MSPPTGSTAFGLRAHELFDERAAALALLRAHPLPIPRLVASLEYLGSAVDLLLGILRGDAPFAGQQVLYTIGREAIEQAKNDLETWQRRGWRVASMLDREYPASLQEIFNRPPLLWLEGSIDVLTAQPIVAVVGSRRASAEGLQRARRLARELVDAKITVASGLAAGIDAMAHQAALDGGGRTFAVMGTGLERRYPKANIELSGRILRAGGALVSQFLPAQGPTRWTFPVRNLTMSGLSAATVVVEAGETSGAKLQAEAALRHGRPVFLPQSLLSTHAWARRMVEGGFHGVRAVAVSSPADIIHAFQRHTADVAPVFV